jgi:hypothetical protein
MHGLVGKHGLTYDVTNREDVWNVRAQLLVDGDETVLVNSHSHLLCGYRVAVGLATNGNQYAIEQVVLRCLWSGEPDTDTDGSSIDLRDSRTEVDVLVALLETFRQGRNQVRVSSGDDLVHHLDDGYSAAELVVNRRHLQPDDAAAYDQQTVRNIGQVQGAG